jgi:hypothetical protein
VRREISKICSDRGVADEQQKQPGNNHGDIDADNANVCAADYSFIFACFVCLLAYRLRIIRLNRLKLRRQKISNVFLCAVCRSELEHK